MKNFSLLEKKLNISFKNKDFLIQSFCHRSYLNENPDFYLNHNERMEFLGDAVLELVVTEYLFGKYPENPEGDLTNWRAALVNARILSETAQELDFNSFLLLSKGETKETGKARQYILANTFEAFVGALYQDQGYESCKNFILKFLIEKKLDYILKEELFKSAKSNFQEIAQEKTGLTPSYRVIKEWGPDHAKHFISGVFLGEEMAAEGEGSSKQEAEENAAGNALRAKEWRK